MSCESNMSDMCKSNPPYNVFNTISYDIQESDKTFNPYFWGRSTSKVRNGSHLGIASQVFNALPLRHFTLNPSWGTFTGSPFHYESTALHSISLNLCSMISGTYSTSLPWNPHSPCAYFLSPRGSKACPGLSSLMWHFSYSRRIPKCFVVVS